MKVILDDNDIIKIVHACFCDGGLSELNSCDVTLEYSEKDYQIARQYEKLQAMLPDCGICFEDILIELFKREQLRFMDHNENQLNLFNLPFVKANLQAVIGDSSNGLLQDVMDVLNEDGNYDATTCFRLLQFMLFKEVIYG